MLRQMSCCGVHEINGISYTPPELSLINIYRNQMYTPNLRGGFLIFTGRAEPEYKYAQVFKDYIVKNKLGNVIESNPRPNFRYLINNKDPKVTHDLKVYIWEVDHDAFAKWFEAHKPAEQVINQF